MKVEFELPDWVSKHQPLMLLAGQELVAFKWPGQDWKIKIVRCNKCGECCLDIPNEHTPFGSDSEGKCNALQRVDNKNEWVCTAAHQKPWCCLGDPLNIEELGCSIRYK
jgi:hypothetical protein